MKRFFKQIKSMHILGISGIAIFLLVLALLYPEVDKIIQSELIVILVVITLFYAIQTQKLAEHEKKIFEDERNKRIAMYAENNLHEFYSPFSVNIFLLNKKIEALNWQNFKGELDKIDEFFEKEISELILKYLYLAPTETTGLTTIMNMFSEDLDELKQDEEEKFYLLKQSCLETLESISKSIYKKLFDCMKRINEVYGVFEPSDMKAVKEILSIHQKSIERKELRKPVRGIEPTGSQRP